jgi:hypothetical protein
MVFQIYGNASTGNFSLATQGFQGVILMNGGDSRISLTKLPYASSTAAVWANSTRISEITELISLSLQNPSAAAVD